VLPTVRQEMPQTRTNSAVAPILKPAYCANGDSSGTSTTVNICDSDSYRRKAAH
jgi:hypothetical protein